MEEQEEMDRPLSEAELRKYDKSLQDYNLGRAPKPNLPQPALLQVRRFQAERLTAQRRDHGGHAPPPQATEKESPYDRSESRILRGITMAKLAREAGIKLTWESIDLLNRRLRNIPTEQLSVEHLRTALADHTDDGHDVPDK